MDSKRGGRDGGKEEAREGRGKTCMQAGKEERDRDHGMNGVRRESSKKEELS